MKIKPTTKVRLKHWIVFIILGYVAMTQTDELQLIRAVAVLVIYLIINLSYTAHIKDALLEEELDKQSEDRNKNYGKTLS